MAYLITVPQPRMGSWAYLANVGCVRGECLNREKSDDEAEARALDFMNDRLGDGVSIGRICAASGASSRTLTRGFRERFGIGPKAYFNCHRLVRVRSGLLRKRTGSNVAAVANEWGFWHMGQFAKDYRQMFGELPSETLNGAKSD